MSEPQQISLREAAALLMANLESRGCTFRWRDAEQHDFTVSLDDISDWRGLPSPDVLAHMILDYRHAIRELLRECQRTH